MRELSIDIETYSSVDLIKSGAYAYADAPDFQIMLFAYAFDDDEIRIVDFTEGESLPTDVWEALIDESVIKTAFNANFERVCLNRAYGLALPFSQWRCTAVLAAELGLPHSLAGVAKVLGLEQQKDGRGKALIRYFCKPCKPSKANGGRARNLSLHAPEKWQEFKQYCIQDVAVERDLKRKLAAFPLPESEQRLWELDQRINDRGVRIDRDMIEHAIDFNGRYMAKCAERAQALTGLENVNSVKRLKSWLENEEGRGIKSLDKSAVAGLMDTVKSPRAREVLELRAKMSKSSISKYKAMERSVCRDGRIRGTVQFYGASRTGRWAGRLIQPQNLPKNGAYGLEEARELLMEGDYELFEMIYGGELPKTLSRLIRTAIIPSEGRRFIVADFSAIEARVIAYLAGERWRLDVFKTHGKIYEASAAQMFKVPIESVTKGSPMRDKGKIAELALGYGGSVGALICMGALNMKLAEHELPDIVRAWRNANPAIVRFWKQAEGAAINAAEGRPSRLPCGLSFARQSGILFIGLPSGRRLAYIKPAIASNKFGLPALSYIDVNGIRTDTFGGKLAENIVQAVARDCLAESIRRIEAAGLEINFHVHDEVIIDAPAGVSSVEEVVALMCEPMPWAAGLPLAADGYECSFYKKE